MRYVVNLISFLILTILIGVGSLVLGTARVMAQAPCNITIEKVADPEDGTPFGFSEGGDFGGTFILMDPGFPITGVGIDIGQTLIITEDVVPEGWTLDSIECVEGTTNCGATSCLTATVDGNSVAFECIDNDTASCVFTNVRAPFVHREIPTLSQWGLITMAGLMGIAGFMIIRRRKVAA